MTASRRHVICFVAVLLSVAACKPRGTDTRTLAADGDGGVADGRAPKGSYQLWAYDPGPFPGQEHAGDLTNPYPTQMPRIDGQQVNLLSPMGKELMDIAAKIPYFASLSDAVYGHLNYDSDRAETQMFRYPFGPIPWRMMQAPNSVKILFIGQDGTHIAEAAGRPATAGFGGRAQDLAAYFGVGSSAAFINTYAFTIRWQYGVFDAPIVQSFGQNERIGFSSFVSNPIWLISQDADSPLVKWRNSLISWIIRNNSESLKMIVLFGGGARDAMGSFVTSYGGRVDARNSAADLANIKVAEFELAGAGGNKQASYPIDANGRDLYRELNNGQQPDYADPGTVSQMQDKLKQAFAASPDTWKQKLVLKGGGINGSGMIHPAQLGGYDINNRMYVNGQRTISLKGLNVDGVTINHDILVTQLPHPTALSMMDGHAASDAVARGLEKVQVFRDNGSWTIEADPGFANHFEAREEYKYRRGDMGAEYYDFGAPNSRMVNVSSASRSGKDTIVFGTRGQVTFNQQALQKMRTAQPCFLQNNQCGKPPQSEMWITRPNQPSVADRFFKYDPGPGVEWAKVMKESLPADPAFHEARAVNGDHAHYRGTFKDPQVVIIADPHGEDDLITARALTGSRGQYLHGMMEDLGVGDRYLVIKTAPYLQDDMWQETVKATRDYRVALLGKLFATTHPKLIITDGPAATTELEAIKASLPTPPSAPIVTIERSSNDPRVGLDQAFAKIKGSVGDFAGKTFSNRMVDIPRSHMTFYARVWEGTSGDRVITASDSNRYKAFAEVAPSWAFRQKYVMAPATIEGCRKLIGKLNSGKLRMGGEVPQKYLQRLSQGAPGADRCAAVGAEGEGSAAGGTAAAAAETPEALVTDAADKDLTHVAFYEPLEAVVEEPAPSPGAQ